MFSSPLRERLLVLGLLLVFSLLSLVASLLTGEQEAALFSSEKNNYLTVTFLDVGQGDAIFIETPDGVQLLIDGGSDSSVLRELAEQMSIFDRKIDVVLATHSDKDHIGGLVDVLKRYQVDDILHTNNKNDTAVTEAFAAQVGTEGAGVHVASAGQQYQLGASTTLFIFSPTENSEEWESNSSSIVAQLQYGEVEFLLTGDAPVNIEEYLVGAYGYLLESEVLKLGHHGSRTSTANIFLDVVKPKYAVVSAGIDNRYGHPHQEVLSKLEERNITVVSTADNSTIVFKSDGKEVWVE